jgi:hypothetical protein
MTRIYVDTSAYLCVVLGEDGAADLAKALEGAQLHSSVLLVLESRRNLVRLARQGHLPAARLNELLGQVAEDMRAFTLRDVGLEICSDPTLPAVATPRSLDLAHLRTALWFHRRQRLDGFLTLDRDQRDAARELGLPAA